MYYIYICTYMPNWSFEAILGSNQLAMGIYKKTLTRACWDDYNVMPQWNVWFIDLINCSFSHKPNGEIRVMPRNCYTTLSPIFNHHVWSFMFCSVNPGLINHGLLIRGVRTLRHTNRWKKANIALSSGVKLVLPSAFKEVTTSRHTIWLFSIAMENQHF